MVCQAYPGRELHFFTQGDPFGGIKILHGQGKRREVNRSCLPYFRGVFQGMFGFILVDLHAQREGMGVFVQIMNQLFLQKGVRLGFVQGVAQ